MKRLILFTAVVLSTLSCVTAQYGYDNYDNRYTDSYRRDRYYYDDEFDWHWDIRVRISDGIKSGLITSWEANRLYNRLENVEQKEYEYTSDGYFDTWEQDEIWEDVAWLNRQVGIQLYDNDRTFYGFSRPGYAFSGYPFWFYRGGFNFYRFDNRGYGSIRLGYAPRHYYPKRYVYTNRDRYEHHDRNYRPRNGSYPNNGHGNRYDNDRNDNNRYDRDNRSYGPRENGRMNTPAPRSNSNERPQQRNNGNTGYQRSGERSYGGNSRNEAPQRIETPRGRNDENTGRNGSSNSGSRTNSAPATREYPRSGSNGNARTSAPAPSSRESRPETRERSASPREREVYHGPAPRKSGGTREQ